MATHVNGLGTSSLHELHEPNLPFVSRIEFIRSKFSNFSAHVSGVSVKTPDEHAIHSPRPAVFAHRRNVTETSGLRHPAGKLSPHLSLQPVSVQR